jgi:predicted metal-dependent enzyme (double-stranded beta helix superfamily)
MVDEEWYLDNERVRSFIETVRATAESHEEIPPLLEELSEPFEALLLDDEWLPPPYDGLVPDGYEDHGEMGGDIAQWLLYRSDDLVLFTLVLPPGVETPVHDHLAWGLVGLYRGTQREEFYQRLDDGGHFGPAELTETDTPQLGRGDYYELIPPDGDIHRVTTTSAEPSVSVHLLGTDVGCLQRHLFDVEDDFVELFQSHDTDVRCERAISPKY